MPALSTHDKAILQDSFWLSRLLFNRFLGLIQLVAFLIAWFQNNSLLGTDGLTPAHYNLKRRLETYANNPKAWYNHFFTSPTLFTLIPLNDVTLNLLPFIGIVLATFVVFRGQTNFLINFTIWLLYLSIVNIGNTWYSFGWEYQLLETTFLSFLIVPLFSITKFPSWLPTPWVGIWANRWLLFRIMLGAGLIKIRSDQCWRDLTCMNYHYTTQPVPGPLSALFHATPESFHHFETAVNHAVELVLPWLLLVPWRPLRLTGAVVQILFQAVIILSGNFAFLNWLTIVPALLCLDDCFLANLGVFGATDVSQAIAVETQHQQLASSPGLFTVLEDDLQKPLLAHRRLLDGANENALMFALVGHLFVKAAPDELPTPATVSCDQPPVFSRAKVLFRARQLFYLVVAVWLGFKSVPVVENLLSSRQVMNRTHDAFAIVNSYGLFGSITKVRNEVVLQGTLSDESNAPDTQWFEFEFACKPGNLNRRPCLITPYHYRMDWLMWFAAMQEYRFAPWTIHLVYKLLRREPMARSLLAAQPLGDPFLELEREVTALHVKSALLAARMSCVADGANPGNQTCEMEPVKLTELRPKHIRAQLYRYEYAVTPSTFLPTLYRSLREEWLRPGHSLLDLALPAVAAYLRTLGAVEESPATSLARRNMDRVIPYAVDADGFEVGLWWKRKLVGSYIPDISLRPQSEASIRDFLKFHRLVE